MAADSNVSDGDRCWKMRKVWRVKQHLLGFAGDTDGIEEFMAWWRGGCRTAQPAFIGCYALVLSVGGLVYYNGQSAPETIRSGREAIGSGAKAAMAAYEALGWTDLPKAVRIAVRHDSGSRGPVKVYGL